MPQHEIYTQLSPREHVLHRPQPYLGDTHKTTKTIWTSQMVAENTQKQHVAFRIRQKTVTFAPALVHLFDEILINALDNRHRDTKNMKLTAIDVQITANEISVKNDGAIIPLRKHTVQTETWLPSMLFGTLLTSSNYNDNENRTTGGRHGLGAKLTNIFSEHFHVDVYDNEIKCRFRQSWHDNMSRADDPIIEQIDMEQPSYTLVSFQPDYKRFDEATLTEDTQSLMIRRVLDVAACSSLAVSLNKKRIEIESFTEYVKLFSLTSLANVTDDSVPNGLSEAKSVSEDERKSQMEIISTKISNGWDVVLVPSDNTDAPVIVSFVNGIATTKGGSHVAVLSDIIVELLQSHIQKKHKLNIPATIIKQSFSLFVNATVTNPSFNSQTKEMLVTPIKEFVDSIRLPEVFRTAITESSIVMLIIDAFQNRQQLELKRSLRVRKSRKLYDILKLEDANFAGTSRSQECTLILTEGDSAKALVLAGLSVIGRDLFGVFPLKGKLLNVRDASHEAVMRNEEIHTIFRILGLQHGTRYDSVAARQTMRYGKLMLMTDQDHDGSHIKGLLINMVHRFFPDLLASNDFLQEFVTAIVKARRGSHELAFYTLPEYFQWRKSLSPTDYAKWNIKYYKGLGTLNNIEAKQYFSNLNQHQISFFYNGEADDLAINLAFSKLQADQRKAWLSQIKDDVHVNHHVKQLSICDFIHQELVLFSQADTVRSIPCMIDGLKPVQRKVLFACFKRDLKKEIKVAQLAGYISEHTGYHHGEASLHSTIVNMAQDYPGANHIPLLLPNGQFGTRHMRGQDAASPRYIFTQLSHAARLIFRREDDELLQYRDEEGLSVEPEFYMPIIPMLLVNGATGIGTGYSTNIPMYNPLDIIRNLRCLIVGKQMQPMLPWQRGFTGVVRQLNDETILTEGSITTVSSGGRRFHAYSITELPWGASTQDFKEMLQSMIKGDGPRQISIDGFSEHHTADRVAFTVHMTPGEAKRAELKGLLHVFKLSKTFKLTNMHAFDENGRIQRYASPLDVIEAFYPIRVEYYGYRKALQLEKMRARQLILNNRVRFIENVISGKLTLQHKSKSELISELLAAEFAPHSRSSVPPTENAEGSASSTSTIDNDSFDYLLDMPLVSLTEERALSLQRDLAKFDSDIAMLSAKTVEQLWLADLDELEKHLTMQQ